MGIPVAPLPMAQGGHGEAEARGELLLGQVQTLTQAGHIHGGELVDLGAICPFAWATASVRPCLMLSNALPIVFG